MFPLYSLLIWIRDQILWLLYYHAPAPQQPNPKLSSELNELTTSENPQECARINDLDLIGGKVRVVIELVDDKNLEFPEHFHVKVESTYKNLVQALVYISRLNMITKDARVRYIRPPKKPNTNTGAII